MRKHLLFALGCFSLLTLLQTRALPQIKGPSSSQTPYLVPTAPGVQFTSILTAGDVVNSYKMAGIPDGTGAFDNGDGTFTFLVNHEIPGTSGVTRAHGSTGAFVSKWIINKSNLSVLSGSDLVQNVKLWNVASSSYITHNAANPSTLGRLSRLCSADLPPVSAFFNSVSGMGTQERIFMNGEESGAEGRGFGHIVTGSNAGTSYELPYLGKFSWENAIAHPAAGDKTVVAGTDDATPGQVYFYIGTKTNTGTEIEKAGLSNGNLYGAAVSGMILETSGFLPAAGTPFSLINLGDVHNMTGAALQTASSTAGVTQFLRPEDGAWDPKHPEDFYFVTTNGFTSPSRLWKMHFNNINDLTQGGTITAVLDGTEGQKMLDNMTIDQWGHILMQEDVGGNAHLGKTWQYTIATDELKEIASHDPARFITGGPNFLTQDEEASGIIDAQDILGAGMFLLVDQTHYSIPGELYEGGQLLAMFNPATYNACTSYTGNISVSPSPAVANQLPNTIYRGYGPQTVTLTASVPAGFPPYSYTWSNGATTNAITVSPTATTTYTVTIKNAFGCAIDVNQTINVIDIRDGDKNKIFICHNGHPQSVSVNAVPAHINHGDQLGICGNEANSARLKTSPENIKPAVTMYPNPVRNTANLSLSLTKNEKVSITVVDLEGRIVMAPLQKNLNAGRQFIELNTSHLTKGTYLVHVSSAGTITKIKMVVLR